MPLQGQGMVKGGRTSDYIFDRTTDADDHICQYKSVGITESWSNEDKKTEFHQTKWNGREVV